MQDQGLMHSFIDSHMDMIFKATKMSYLDKDVVAFEQPKDRQDLIDSVTEFGKKPAPIPSASPIFGGGRPDSALIKKAKSFTDNKGKKLGCVIEDKGVIYIAFQGTQVGVDWIYNFNAKPSKALAGEGLCHTGFKQRYKDAFDSMRGEIMAISNWQKKTIVFTGHSLGGATAQIAAHRFALETAPEHKVDMNKVFCVTYSSPRVFDSKAAQEFERAFDDRAVRINTEGDPIPEAISSHLGYVHASCEVVVQPHVKTTDEKQLHSINNLYVNYSNADDVTPLKNPDHDEMEMQLKDYDRKVAKKYVNATDSVRKKFRCVPAREQLKSVENGEYSSLKEARHASAAYFNKVMLYECIGIMSCGQLALVATTALTGSGLLGLLAGLGTILVLTLIAITVDAIIMEHEKSVAASKSLSYILVQ